jgi:NAD(P)-dependent dehydrogenase (short-subunit alcohol dehydrogenase family)
MDFGGRRALVTGAGKGIGRNTAIMLAERGAQVTALSRSPEDLATLAAEIDCRTIAVDLADLPASLAAIGAALPFDLLVNNAGIARLETFLATTQRSFAEVLAINLHAPMFVAQTVAADMVARGARGAIVNVSSIAAAIGLPEHAAYCASKAGLDALTRVMATELGPHGIRVNSVNPAVTLTPMGAYGWSDPAKADPMLARMPLGRFLESDEVAEAICWLLDDASRMVTGISMDVDGGFRIR